MASFMNKKEARALLTMFLVTALIVAANQSYKLIMEKKLIDELNNDPNSYVNDSTKIFQFDPNTVQLRELVAFGLSKQDAVSIIRYREMGKTFRIKEDLFTCYGLSDSIYYMLEPHIVIADTFKYKKRVYPQTTSSSYSSKSYTNNRYQRKLLPVSKFMVDTVGVKYLVAIGALTRRQAEVFVRWRDLSGIYNMDEFRECYVISDSVATSLAPYLIFPEYEMKPIELLDLNRADSAELRAVYGVGEKSVVAILEFRTLLGGFYSVNQLSELKVITESNFEKIIKQISCDSCDISKIDVNFASAKRMKGHPYIADRALRRLLKIRELKGGWSTVEEMIEDEIFNTEEATRVRPYLLFGEFEPRVVVDKEFS